MSRKATPIILTDEEHEELESWVRKGTMEQRMVQRARIVLEAAAGKTTGEIALMLKLRAATVSQWRNRFSRNRLSGLEDKLRTGKAAKYNRETEERILAELDAPPPEGYATWTGRLLAQSLGNVSPHHVWRVLRRHGIHLQRRRSWCVSTDPEFAQKAADIVGLYLNPPENAVVISVDEKPAIQALERAQGRDGFASPTGRLCGDLATSTSGMAPRPFSPRSKWLLAWCESATTGVAAAGSSWIS